MVRAVNKLVVTIDKKFQDEITLSSGLKLYQETRFNPEQHVTTMGKVVASPKRLNDMVENEGVSLDIEDGDEVCFNYQVISEVDNNGNHKNMFELDGEQYWIVDYTQVFFAKRGDEVIPIAGTVILEQIENEEKSYKDSMILKASSHTEKFIKGAGILTYIGKPLAQDPLLDVMPGEKVLFRPDVAAEYEIFGKKRWVVSQQYLLAKEN